MSHKAAEHQVERREKPRWSLSWWGYLLTLAAVFLVLIGSASIVYG